jgi:hypothetical protein
MFLFFVHIPLGVLWPLVSKSAETIVQSVNENVSRTECPFCGADDWIGNRLVAVPTTEIDPSLESRPEPTEMTTLAVVVWICADCGFLRAHSIAPGLFE